MIEAANKQIKYHFLYHKEIANFEQLVSHLHQAVEDYRNRPHDVLKGLTPNEVLKGELPANVCFANQIVKARMVRLKENKSSKCCNYIF
jgi:hypothetical protein